MKLSNEQISEAMRQMGRKGGVRRGKTLSRKRRKEIAKQGAIAMHTLKGHKLTVP